MINIYQEKKKELENKDKNKKAEREALFKEASIQN